MKLNLTLALLAVAFVCVSGRKILQERHEGSSEESESGCGSSSSEEVELCKCPYASTGKFTDPKNCHNYYVCNKGKAYKHRCDGGLKFNYKTGNCERHVKDCGMVCPTDPCEVKCPASPFFSRLPNPSNCRDFYECLAGVRVPFSCKPDEEFDSISSKCVPAGTAKCSVYDCPAGPDPCVVPECPATGASSLQFPDPTDCTYFYQCVNGQATGPQQCPAGLIFNFENQGCYLVKDHPCYRPRQCPPKVSCDVPACPATGYSRLAEPSNSCNFYQCYDGIRVCSSCPEGKRFDNGECVPGECVASPCPAPTDCCVIPDCPAKVFGLPEPSNCKQYYTCFQGKRIGPSNCPPGTTFSFKDFNCLANYDCLQPRIPSTCPPPPPRISEHFAVDASADNVHLNLTSRQYQVRR